MEFDELYGGSGNDVVAGGESGDAIVGGLGSDVLTGDVGPDTFVFLANTGQDTVTDFDLANDVIQLSINGIAEFSDLDGMVDDSSGSTMIDFGGGHSITLTNVTGLTPDQFSFQPPVIN